ncbi:Phenyloxazoline synthase MbtB [Methylobacterium bullatum]|uniref:Phenyloxazoline synthase MbtB n=1 Tax=Methylobacterium bullatum TaxID=570505 RepID=A0A679J0P5_9HYPH|nr:Phenyloxazoline synthase MbtB [Methylobacterium bullatum]
MTVLDSATDLSQIWREVLRLPNAPEATDGFFALGGCSFDALLIIDRVRIALGVEIDFGTFLNTPDFGAFVKAVAAAPRAVVGTVSLPSVAIDAPFPMTEVQRAYWLGRTRLFELGGVAAHGYVEIDARHLDPDRLETALNRTIERHPMLRATVGDDGLQQIHACVPAYRIARADLKELSEADRILALDATRSDMACQVLPADRWPLFDIRYSTMSEDSGRLHVSFDVLFLDLASLERWMQEWAAFYERPESHRTAPALTFVDCIAALDHLKAGTVGDVARAYWMARLDTLPPCPELPLILEPARIDVPRFSRRHRELPPDAWTDLQKHAAAAGITPTSLLLTAYAEVLAQWSRSPHFTINVTLFNRPSIVGVDEVLGDFTSLNLLEADLRPAATLTERARGIQAQLWQDLEHRMVSGVEVMGRLAERQRASRKALMPVVFTSGLGVGSLYDAFGRFGDVTHSVTQTPQTWLDHQVMERDGGLMLIWDAVEDLFPAGLLDAMFDAYADFVCRLAQDRAAWDVPVPALIPAAQAATRLTANATDAEIPSGLLHGPFLERARQEPGRLAVIATDRSLTYGELDRASDGLAERLIRAGGRRGELAAVCLPRGWRQVVAVLGILKAGMAYLPLDQAWPNARIAALLARGEAKFCVGSPDLGGTEDVRCFDIDTAWLEATTIEDGFHLVCPATPDDLAYVIFTSGSTGTPKGVMIEHRAALNTILDINARYEVRQSDRAIALSALSFDLSVYDIFGILAAGGAIVMPPPAAAPDPGAWHRHMLDHGVTVWNTVPALLRLLVDHLKDRDALHSLADLRVVMTSGDWLPLPLAETVSRLPGERVFVSLGGATEAAIWSIAQRLRSVEPDWISVPYGLPLANQRWHVLDTRLAPRPDWVPGELFIAGAGLARGYWRDPSRTQAHFLTHPVTGERLYRTGDTGRVLPDGTIEFLGRDDGQVKINGLRVELGEIEAALGRDDAIREAAATVVRSADRGDRLVAFVVPASVPLETAALRTRLLDQLPAALVPVSIFPVPALPLGSNAKVDRTALVHEAERREDPQPAPTRTPAGETERRISQLWSELLGSGAVSVERNFFEAGGTSLVATRLAQRLSSVFDGPFPVVSIFEHPTIAEQAALLERRRQSDETPPVVNAAAATRGDERRRILVQASRGHLRS